MSKLQSGFKFTYDPQNSKWVRERVRVQLAKNPFAQGGMRVVYRMREFDPVVNDGEYVESVAKKFKPDCEEKQYYYDEAMTQMVCESYAQEFNRRRPENQYIGFLPVSVLRIDEDKTLYNTEPYLRGEYLKHNDNSGHVDTQELLPQAFSHFSYEASNQTLIVVDIQGVGNYYTDPQIHSFNGEGFGLGNLGQSGIRKFLQSHKCNRLCKALGLRDPKKKGANKETDEEMAKRLQEEELRNTPEYQQKCNWTSQRYTQEINGLKESLAGALNKEFAALKHNSPPKKMNSRSQANNIVIIRSTHGMFVRALHDGSVRCDSPEAKEWEMFKMIQLGHNDKVAFLSHHGTYLCAEKGKGVICNRRQVGAWETFEIHKSGYTVSFRTAHGSYLTAQSDGSLNHHAGNVGDSERFSLTYAQKR